MHKKRCTRFPLAAVLFLLFLTACTSSARAAEIDDIDAGIAAKHAHWRSRATSVHRMSHAHRKMRASLNLPTAVPSSGTQTTMAEPLTTSLTSLDWRNFGGVSYVTAVKDQGNCGSCWAFAATGALEAYTQIHSAYDTNLNLSEQIMVSCSNAGSCNGGYIESASTFIQHTGLPTDSAYPYTAANGACSSAAANWQSSAKKIAVWDYIVSGGTPSITAMKNALYTYGPLVTTMAVYNDFFAYGSGIYTHTSGSLAGYHAILIVGFADDSQVPGGGYFIVKNSWGPDWGEAGYFRIAYSETTSACAFGRYTIAYDAAVQTCSYALSGTGGTLGNSAGTGSVGVITAGSCTWSAQSSAPWLSTTTTASKGNGAVNYSATANTVAAPRTGTVTILDASANAVGTFTVTQAAYAPPVTLTGTITSGGTGVSGAVVNLSGPTAATATTGSTGGFSIANLPAGSYAVSVSKAGFNTFTNTALVLTAASHTLNAALTPISYTVRGSVASAVSPYPAVAGAMVTVGQYTTTTAADGTFTAAGIPSGTVLVTAVKGGFNTASFYVAITGNSSVTVKLTPTPYTVSGTVRTSSGTALVGAVVRVGSLSATTSSSGAYSISGLSAGTYSVTAALSGYGSYSGTLAVSASQVLNIVLAPASYTVSGTVRSTSSTGPVVAGAVVSIGGKSTVSASNGTFSVSGIGAGTVPITVSRTGFVTSSAYLGVSGNLTVTSAIMPITYTVSGTVKSSTGAALSGATVSIGTLKATTSSTGAYSIAGVAAGTYPATISRSGYLPYSSSTTVSANQTLNGALTLITFTVSGTVKTSSGAVLGGASVAIGTATAASSSTGTFSIAGLLPGTYAVKTTATGYLAYSGTLTVSANQSVTLALAPLTYKVTGNVKYGSLNGLNAAGAIVTIGKLTATTGSDGNFAISGIPYGYASALVTKAGYAPFSTTMNMTGNVALNAHLIPSPPAKQ